MTTAQVLALRPGNALQRLPKGSDVCVVNPRDLYRALEPTKRAVLCVSARARPMIPGVLHAAKLLDACVGFQLGPDDFEQTGLTPESYFQAVVSEAQAVGFSRPIFLHADRIPIGRGDQGKESARSLAFRFADAGFTSASFAPAVLAAPEAASVTAHAAEPFLERELAVEVLAPRWVGADGIARLSEACEAAGLRDAAILLERALPPSARRMSLLGLEALTPAALRELAGTGYARVGASARFTARFTAALPPELGEELERHAAEQQEATGAVLRAIASRLAQLSPAVLDRLEASAFAEAFDLLQDLGARGSGSVALRFFAEHAGY